MPLTDLSRLCIHTITTKPWSIEEAAKNYSATGVKGITVWRDALAGQEYKTDRRDVTKQWSFSCIALQGRFFPEYRYGKRKAALDDNSRAIEEAFELGTDKIVLVCGADPAQSLEESRKQILDGICCSYYLKPKQQV